MSTTAATRGRTSRARGARVSEPVGQVVRSTFEGRLLAALLSAFALAALFLGEELVLLAGLFALGTALSSRLVAGRNLRGVTVRRTVPPRARVGVPAPVAYEIGRDAKAPAVGIQIEDGLGGPSAPRRIAFALPTLPAGKVIQSAQPVTFLRRGRFTLGRPRLRSQFPLALFEASTPAAEPTEILVRPREGRPGLRLRELLSGRTQAYHRPSLRVRGDDVFHGIREFRDGDDPRRIHWRTTARRGVLTVSEWHREEGREVVVFLGRSAGPGPNTQGDFERAVSVAATVVRLAARHGLRTRLVLGASEEARRPAPRNPVRSALDALALVKGQGGRRPRSSLRRLAGKGGSRIVVYVASGPEPGIRPRLQAAAGPHGASVLLEAHEPGIARWVRGLP